MPEAVALLRKKKKKKSGQMAILIHIQCLRDNTLEAELDRVYKYLIGDLCTVEHYYSTA